MTESVDRRAHRVDLFATILLAVAAVGTAWSTYQSTQWRGEQAVATSKATGGAHPVVRGLDACGPADAGRHRHVHPVGRRRRQRRREACALLSQAFSRRVPARLRRLARHRAEDEPGRSADAVRDAPVPRDGARKSSAPQHPRRGPRGCGRTGEPTRRRRHPRRRALRRARCSSRASRRSCTPCGIARSCSRSAG